jgi:hypothetical protein
MCGVITVKVKDTLPMSVLPQRGLEPSVSFVVEIMQSKSVGTLNNRRLLIRSIVVNLVLGNKNGMDQDLTPVIILKGILTVVQYPWVFRDVPIGINEMILPIGTDLLNIIKTIRGSIQTPMTRGNILFVIGVRNSVITPTTVQTLRNHRIMFLCVATARQQDTPQMSVPILRRITLLMKEIGKRENEWESKIRRMRKRVLEM